MMGNQGDVIYGIAVSSSSLLFAMAVLSGFLVLAILISMMRIYKKAGKPSISAIIPIWSQIVLFQIVDKPVWYVILLLVPIANIVIMFQAYILLARKFGKGTGFGIGMVFLPMIFIPLLSFYDYVGNEETKDEPIYNPFNESNVEQVMPSAPVEIISETLVSPTIKESSNISMESNQQNVTETIGEVSNETLQSSEPVNETVISVVEPINEINSFQPVDSYVDKGAETTSYNYVTEPVNMEMNLNQENVISETNLNDNEINIIESLQPDIPVIEEPIKENGAFSNPTVQDIEAILNKKPLEEPKNIAFGASPEVVQTSFNGSEGTNSNDSLDVLKVEEKSINAEEVIEMPEIAAKACPACGVSLAEDIKFCTSCGTQL